MAYRAAVRPRRPHRPRRLPPLGPQRGRRARLHAARDVQRIKQHPTVGSSGRERLIEQGDGSEDDAEARPQRCAGCSTTATSPRGGRDPAAPTGTARGQRARPGERPCRDDRCARSTSALLHGARGLPVNPKLCAAARAPARGPRRGRRHRLGHAEALAFARLLEDGTPIRMTGQDAERGTFRQRHLVLHDAETGETYTPMQTSPTARRLRGLQPPLSETAALGFEYGYSVTRPETLVLWEAQFGDFVNGRRPIIDQFIVAGRAKWGQLRAGPAAAARLRGPGAGAFLRPPRAVPEAGPPRTTSGSPMHDPGPVLPPAAAAGAPDHRRPLILMTPKSLLRLKDPRRGSRT